MQAIENSNVSRFGSVVWKKAPENDGYMGGPPFRKGGVFVTYKSGEGLEEQTVAIFYPVGKTYYFLGREPVVLLGGSEELAVVRFKGDGSVRICDWSSVEFSPGEAAERQEVIERSSQALRSLRALTRATFDLIDLGTNHGSNKEHEDRLCADLAECCAAIWPQAATKPAKRKRSRKAAATE